MVHASMQAFIHMILLIPFNYVLSFALGKVQKACTVQAPYQPLRAFNVEKALLRNSVIMQQWSQPCQACPIPHQRHGQCPPFSGLLSPPLDTACYVPALTQACILIHAHTHVMMRRALKYSQL